MTEEYKARLCIDTLGGKEYVSILWDMKSREDDWRVKQGYCKYVNLTEDEVALGLKILTERYKAQAAANAAAEALDKRMKTNPHEKSYLVKILVRIIKESNQKGERENAKDLYTKITGEPWTEPEVPL